MSTYEIKRDLLKKAFKEGRGPEVIQKIQASLNKVRNMGHDDTIDYNRLKWDTVELSRDKRTACILAVIERLEAGEPAYHTPAPHGLFSRSLN